jgi:F420-dependent oxidoreductase-like protein
MRISIWPGAEHTWAEVLSMAQHAEATGWDGVWIADHFMPDGEDDLATPMLECGSLVAALGAVVPRVTIGTLVYGNTYRHPAVLANMATTVDHISGGRFILGVGAGWQKTEHREYGIELPPTKQLIDRFEEAVRVMLGLLRTTRTTVDGQYYQVVDAVNEPKPVQDPLPLMIGAKGEKRMLGIVAKYADMWNGWGVPSVIAHKSAVLDEHCARIGRDPATIRRTAQALVAVDGGIPSGLGGTPVIGGSRAELAAVVEQYRAIGLDELIVPDDLLGEGAERLTAMDTILAIVRAS